MSKIVCHAGVLVDQINFIMSNGQVHVYGGMGGNECPPFEIGETEVITKIEGTHREWQSHPDQVLLGCFRVVTSTGNHSPWYGHVSGLSDNISNNKLGRITCCTTSENPIVGLDRIIPGFLTLLVSLIYWS